MELFTQLFGDLLAFVYHCFDRIVIYGYLSGLSRPEQVVHFFRNARRQFGPPRHGGKSPPPQQFQWLSTCSALALSRLAGAPLAISMG